MYIYLSKKIAVPNNLRLNCIAWNKKHGYIAVGGEDGLLKVLRADSNSAQSYTIGSIKSRSMSSTSNLSMNQTLEGHNGHVQVVTWNEEYQKLTSSDQNGVIIVWVLHKGNWYEEMINNRNKSIVRGMAWSSNGQKICIAYEDGAVIVGAVDGSRVWGKEFKGVCFTSVQWSPSGKFLLFGTRNGEVMLYDDQGIFLMKLDHISDVQSYPVSCIHWYSGKNGYIGIDCPVLAIGFQSGKLCLLRDSNDEDPIVIDTEMAIVWCTWNTHGSLLAIAGMTSAIINAERKDSNIICFYNPYGELLKILKIPGREITCCDWEGDSLKLCMSVDSNIYFANLKPKYKWAYFSNTVVFTDEKISRDGVRVTFWNIKSAMKYYKFVPLLLSIVSASDLCTLAAKNDELHGGNPYVLYVCNSISTAIDTKFLEIQPLFLSMNNNTVVVANKSNFLVWNFRIPQNSVLNIGKVRKDRYYHIDDTPTGVTEVVKDSEKNRAIMNKSGQNIVKDPICCITMSDKLILIARESGSIQQYSLPQIALTNRYPRLVQIESMQLNCDSTRACLIDIMGNLNLLDLQDPRSNKIDQAQREQLQKFERKDTWTVCWASDNPEMFVSIEKNKIYIFKGLEPEEPVNSNGYLCRFRDLEVRSILLDELIQKPEETKGDLIVDIEAKLLRNTKSCIEKLGLKETYESVRDNPHPRLWKLLAAAALRQLDLETAENALVRCSDYLGIKFVKRLRNIQDDRLKKAEVAAYLEEYDEAEAIYLDMDRRDLAINLRQKLGDDTRVLKLMKMGTSGGSDREIERAHLRLGQQCRARQDWKSAKEHFEQAGDSENLIDCYYKLEEYEKLGALIQQLPENSPALQKLARILTSARMCQEAVAAYVKLGNVRKAVNTCVRYNRWDEALDLARECKIPQIDELLAKYAQHLLTTNKRLQAVELYKKAGCRLEAAKLLLELAHEQASGPARLNPVRLKRLYVLGALLVQEHLEAAPAPRALGRSGMILGLAQPSADDARLVEGAWRGAEAYHFLLLAHRQLYRGDAEAATRTALRLSEYDDLLDSERVNALLALCGCTSNAFAIASRAFSRLEALEVLTQAKRNEYENLAIDIFLKNPVKDQIVFIKVECPHCSAQLNDWSVSCPNCASKFPGCIVTGKPLHNVASTWLCNTCKHRAISEREIVNINACPLCHSIITYIINTEGMHNQPESTNFCKY